ncbi:RING finger protein [uncultured Sphaerochaeta sp.]|uniref:RING finger protein n=1 Tax=uncultured Sphaerochaeta sp. TaxID=886478 RepID=UPI002A0A817A|nr:RING finger protein [uncultured Sphaerochaeta sp.]
MAYCIQCGVKLEDGAKKCPLCHTEVVLPTSMTEQKKDPLFPEPMPAKGSSGLKKTSKGVVELTLALLFISELTVFFSMWFSGNIAYSFIPLFCLFMAAVIIIIAFSAKHTFAIQVSFHSLAVSVLLLGLDGSDWSLSWSLVTVGAIFLTWIILVLPTMPKLAKHPVLLGCISLVASLVYVAFINIFGSGALTWFFPVAIPASLVLLLGLGLMYVRFFRKNTTRLPLADLVFFILAVISLTMSALDLFSTHYLLGIWGLRWSVSLLVAAILLVIFLTAVTMSRRIRRYFTSQNKHV